MVIQYFILDAAWQQHDVQELCRVMFDALEKNWKNTDQANLITQLYQGKIKDYVKCLQCQSESARIDTYLDIPLVVRPFGANVGHGSVEEALRAFVEPETLEGSNQYFCEKCNCKCNAHKGLKFLTFPYLLTLQLKRFDFDYNTMHRIKLNDRMSFPEKLNLSQFVEAENEKEFMLSKGDLAASGDSPLINSTTLDHDEGVDEGIDIADSASGTTACGSLSESSSSEIYKNSPTNEPANMFEYELFSIMVHSGGASGGHYYAYIKSFRDGQWYSYNDQHVYKILEDDIEKTFGGSSYSSSYYSYSSYSSSANAYMLMYRQIDRHRNKAFIQESEFPRHLVKQLNLLKCREEQEQIKREQERNTCKIKLFYYDNALQKYIETKLEVHKSKTFAEATRLAQEQLCLRHVLIQDFRLVKFDSTHEYIDSSFEDEWSTPIYQVLGGVKSSYGFDLLAETKKRGEQFEKYVSGDVVVRIIPVDVVQETVKDSIDVRISPAETVQNLKELVAAKLNVDNLNNIRCVIEQYYNKLKPLDTSQKSLHSEGFHKTNKVYVNPCSSMEDLQLPFEKTAFYHLLDRHQNTIRLIINVPKLPLLSPAILKNPKQEVQTSTVNKELTIPLLTTDHRDTEEKLSNDMDEGIGESEIDILSTADVANDNCVISTATMDSELGSVETSESMDVSCEPPTNKVSNDTACFASIRQDVDHCLFVNTGDEEYESYDVNLGLSELTSDMLTSHSLSQDSSSSRTVEVGEDIQSPSPLGDDEYSDRVTPSSRTTPSPSTSPPPVTPSPIAVSPNINVSDSRPPPLTFSHETDKTDLEKQGLHDKVDTVEGGKENVVVWDEKLVDLRADDEDDIMARVDESRYFVVEHTSFPFGFERTLFVHVDRRITLKGFKTALEPHIGAAPDNFRVYKQCQGGQEIEETKLNDSLVNYSIDTRVNIKYGRALKVGEQRIQIYQLVLNDAEPIKLLTEVVLAKGMTVGVAKSVIVEELRSGRILDISCDQCRLRRKCWKNPSHIYTDNTSTLEEGLGNPLNSELLLEVLESEPLPVNHAYGELSVYVRRWWPSKLQIDTLHEICTDNLTLENLHLKISQLSGIAVENVCIAKGRGAFPCEMSALEVEKELEWNPNVQTIGQWPLSVTDDGCVVYFKDKSERMLELNDEQKKQLQQKESSRLMKRSSPLPYTGRKERALKIYTEDRPTVAVPPAKNTELSPPSPQLD